MNLPSEHGARRQAEVSLVIDGTRWLAASRMNR
jgi:hypothetical protein